MAPALRTCFWLRESCCPTEFIALRYGEIEIFYWSIRFMPLISSIGDKKTNNSFLQWHFF